MSQSICSGSEPAVLLLLVSELGGGDLAQRLESGKCRGFARPGHLGGPPWPESGTGAVPQGLGGLDGQRRWVVGTNLWHKQGTNTSLKPGAGHLGKVIFRQGIVFTQLDMQRAGSAAQGAPSWDLETSSAH